MPLLLPCSVLKQHVVDMSKPLSFLDLQSGLESLDISASSKTLGPREDAIIRQAAKMSTQALSIKLGLPPLERRLNCEDFYRFCIFSPHSPCPYGGWVKPKSADKPFADVRAFLKSSLWKRFMLTEGALFCRHIDLSMRHCKEHKILQEACRISKQSLGVQKVGHQACSPCPGTS